MDIDTQQIDLFRKRLKGHIKATGGSERNFAKAVGIKQSTLRSILGGGDQGPSLSRIYELLGALGENTLWSLLTGKEPPTKATRPPDLKVVTSKTHSGHVKDAIEQGRYFSVRILRDAVAAGPPAEINEEDVESWALIYADRQWMPHDPDKYTCVFVRGKSMFPILSDGDIVAIDHAEKPTDLQGLKRLNGKMVAFRVNGGVTIKWLKLVEDEKTVIGIPENKEELDHLVVLRGEAINEGIVGLVRWWWAKR